MKYILMCGGNYKHWEMPRHLSIINGEEILARTIRLLKENGIKDISISTTNPIFEKFNLPILKHENDYEMKWHDTKGDWLDCFYLTKEPVCYILGDVYFSEEAIKTIVETKTNDIELFGSIPPFTNNYIKNHIEAFALKVQNTKHLKEAIKKTRELDKQNKFWRNPIIWELWSVIKDTPIQEKGNYIYNYTRINDYTCDVDWQEDIFKLNIKVGGKDMKVKLQATRDFTLGRFNEIKIIKRKNKDQVGWVYTDDVFECNKDMADYLTGNNDNKLVVAKVLEIETPPKEIKKNEIIEDTTIKEEIKETKKKKRSKK